MEIPEMIPHIYSQLVFFFFFDILFTFDNIYMADQGETTVSKYSPSPHPLVSGKGGKSGEKLHQVSLPPEYQGMGNSHLMPSQGL